MSIIPNINNQSIAILSDIESWKEDIADAINTKGGSASADSSFSQLAEDVLAMPTSGILANGITQTEPFSFLKYLTSNINNEITEINNSEITTITRDYAFYKNIALRKVSFFKLVSIISNSTFEYCTSLQSVEFPSIVTISGNNIFSRTLLQSVEFPSLVNIQGNNIFSENAYLKSFIAPNLSNLISGSYFGLTYLNNVVIGKVQVMERDIFYSRQTHLRNITIGPNTDVNTLIFSKWVATTVIEEGQSGIDELNSNLYNNLLTKLYDHSNDGETRILQIGWLDYITPENIAYANAKGWTITN